MKKKVLAMVMAGILAAGSLLAGCGSKPGSGGSDGGAAGEASGGEEGKVINIYSWNDEFRERVEAVYPEVKETSSDGTVTTLNDGTEIHWIINPNQDGVYQQKLDEALLKQGRVAADDRIDMFLVEADYALKYVDPEVNVALPISQLGITDADIANQYRYTLEAMTTADGEIRGLSYQATPGMLVYRRSIAQAVYGRLEQNLSADISFLGESLDPEAISLLVRLQNDFSEQSIPREDVETYISTLLQRRTEKSQKELSEMSMEEYAQYLANITKGKAGKPLP